jgi:hypothetical protein
MRNVEKASGGDILEKSEKRFKANDSAERIDLLFAQEKHL